MFETRIVLDISGDTRQAAAGIAFDFPVTCLSGRCFVPDKAENMCIISEQIPGKILPYEAAGPGNQHTFSFKVRNLTFPGVFLINCHKQCYCFCHMMGQPDPRQRPL
jgi:hypothetical protein